MIAWIGGYWTVTSKKLKVMYSSLYYSGMLRRFIIIQTRQLGRFHFLSALWLMDM